jgi:glycyl-tRNA synthetase (class II)
LITIPIQTTRALCGRNFGWFRQNVFSGFLKLVTRRSTLEDGSTRTVLRLPSVLAPTKAAVLPLVKKDGLPEVASKIIDDLKWDFNVAYDEKDAVGRRYRRQDALRNTILYYSRSSNIRR